LPQPGTDIIQLFGDEDTFVQMVSPFLTDDFQSAFVFPGHTQTYAGPEGLHKNWLDWLEPWATYRTNIDELIDVGERVVVLFRDRARRKDMDEEVELIGGQIWAIREGKVARIEDYSNRAEALEAAGLAQDGRASS
jgi:hypothetical protein